MHDTKTAYKRYKIQIFSLHCWTVIRWANVHSQHLLNSIIFMVLSKYISYQAKNDFNMKWHIFSSILQAKISWHWQFLLSFSGLSCVLELNRKTYICRFVNWLLFLAKSYNHNFFCLSKLKNYFLFRVPSKNSICRMCNAHVPFLRWYTINRSRRFNLMKHQLDIKNQLCINPSTLLFYDCGMLFGVYCSNNFQ